MRTTTYRAPDKRLGYTAGDVAGILSKHDPAATLIARVGFRGQLQQLIVTEDDRPLVERHPHLAEREDLVTRCETPPPGAHPEHVRTDPMRTTTELDGIMRATAAEELVREELHAAGVDVAAVENAVRRAQQRGLGGAA